MRTIDGFCGVGDDAVTPTAHLVAEDPEAASPATAHHTLRDDTTLDSVAVSDRCLLDHEPPLRHAHVERRVIEVARWSPLEPRRHGLENAPVQANRVAARAERQPVQINARDRYQPDEDQTIFGRPCSSRVAITTRRRSVSGRKISTDSSSTLTSPTDWPSRAWRFMWVGLFIAQSSSVADAPASRKPRTCDPGQP
jgi:hypothetical protein